jgi:hypothetical protein
MALLERCINCGCLLFAKGEREMMKLGMEKIT